MKIISMLLLPILFTIGCSNSQKSSQELLDTIFSNKYETKIISQGDNRPDFDRRKDSINLFLVALHEKINPEQFKKKAGWSDEMMEDKIQFLKDKGWLLDDDKGLRPTIFIVSEKQGTVLFKYGKALAEKIAQSIENEIPSIKEEYQKTGLSVKYHFDSLSFLILSNVLLDDWQIMKMEEAYLKKENRPERHGKNYYAGIMENNNYPKESFGIYGNQFNSINDSTFLSIYGNNRNISNDRLNSDPNFRDSVLIAAPKLTPVLYNFFDKLADDYRPILLKILNEQSDYSYMVYEKTGYSDEITFEEFFIWWYHFIYTDATNILAKKNLLIIPVTENFYYRH